jgi:benzoate/toluate 1,2-dioxygenase reductase component
MTAADTFFPTRIIARRWLSQKTFELQLTRPRGFDFLPGQRVRMTRRGSQRDYSIVSAPLDPDLHVCIRSVPRGTMTPFLGSCDIPTDIRIDGPHGYFTFKPSRRTPVFVATGTGIAPFCAMARSNVTGFVLFHGVGEIQDLYHKDRLTTAASQYIPCISNETRLPQGYFSGRVTAALDKHLEPGAYDFYLCGNRDMIRDVTHLVDRQFPGSRVYSEIFF